MKRPACRPLFICLNLTYLRPMRITLILFFIIVNGFTAFGQGDAKSWIQKGIEQHDNGNFEQAILNYKKALEINPNTPLAHYEMSLTYMYMRDYKNMLYHSSKVLETKNKYHLQAYLAKGSAEDNLGKSKTAIKTFRKAIKKYPDNALLRYNTALTYYRDKQKDKAEIELKEGIRIKRSHSSSHLLLGGIVSEKKQNVKSLLAHAFFLLLEPSTKRSKNAYNKLMYSIYGNVNKDKNESNSITIFMDPSATKESEFSSAKLFIPLMVAANMGDSNATKSNEELLPQNLNELISFLGDKKKKYKNSIYQKLYVPFFVDLKKEGFIDAYCAHIGQEQNDISKNWIANNEVKYKAFISWLKEQSLAR